MPLVPAVTPYVVVLFVITAAKLSWEAARLVPIATADVPDAVAVSPTATDDVADADAAFPNAQALLPPAVGRATFAAPFSAYRRGRRVLAVCQFAPSQTI